MDVEEKERRRPGGGWTMATGASGMDLQHLRDLFRGGSFVGLTDDQLLARYASARDGPAFEALVVRHGPMVVATCRAILKHEQDVEDAFQATFLVLARKAGSVRAGVALGGWLHRVAYRIAVQAKGEANQRRRLESEVAAMESSEAADPGRAIDHDLRSILYEQIERLPERERLPVILCDLEGLTYEQAAGRLQWTASVVCYRLSKARKRLRDRLARRGVTPALVAVVMASTRETATAALPASWARAAVAAATGGPTSAAAAALTHTMIKGMLMNQLKVGLVFGMAAALMISAGVVVLGDGRPAPGGATSVEEPRSVKTITQPEARPVASIEVRGRVIGPDGKPFAGARIYAYRPSPRGDDHFAAGPPAPDAVSDADGHFRFMLAEPGYVSQQVQSRWTNPTVVALARGFGPGFASPATADAAGDLTLKLVRDDVPIDGRIIDLEGRPVPDVTVRPLALWASSGEDLTEWEHAMAGAKDIYDGSMGKLSNSLELYRWGKDLAVTTDAEGRFRMTGIGRERVVSLWIEGPTIATSFADIHARTRPGPTYHLAGQRDKPEFGTLVFHGATFEQGAAPTRPIEGIVRDKDTGQPLAGVSIRSQRFAGNVISGRDHVRTTTGADGRYRLVGMPGGAGNRITANPGPAQPYLGAGDEVPSGQGPEPATVDFALKHGVAIRGKVSDRATGKPVPALVEYFVFVDNPHRGQAGGLHGGEIQTRADGSFELVGLPGRGLVSARAIKDHYLIGQGADKIPGAGQNGEFRTDPHICQPEFTHAIVAIEPAEDARSLTCDLALDPGRSRPGTVVGPDGKPVAGCVAINLCPPTMSLNIDTLNSEAFTAIALDPKKPRPLFFRHDEKKLAALVERQGRRERAADRPPPAGRHHHRATGRRRRRAPARRPDQRELWERPVRSALLLAPARAGPRRRRSIPDRRADPGGCL